MCLPRMHHELLLGLARTVYIYILYMTVCMVISLLKIPYVHHIYIHTVYGRLHGDFPAKNTVCTLYIYIPYMAVCMVISLPKILYVHHIYTYRIWPCMVISLPYVHRIYL
jgi:hypothetical protein